MKNAIKKMAPRATSFYGMFRRLPAEITSINERLLAINARLDEIRISGPQQRLKSLQNLLKEVEIYQPPYHISGLIDTPMRDSYDRCVAIEKALGPVEGMRILDIGSSLGYFSYYFADRGAVVEGWEENTKNAEAARLIGEINGVKARFLTKELTNETASQLRPFEYDACFVLSVFHHVIRFQGLAATQEMIKQIMDNVPILVVELAKKGEDPSLPWDASQPKDELEIFKLVREDVKIEKIGDFGNHLSKKTRPLYIVRRKSVAEIGSKKFIYEKKQNFAYKNTQVAYGDTDRKYFFSEDKIAKVYNIDHGKPSDAYVQIFNEVQLLTDLESHKVHHLIKLSSFDVFGRSVGVIYDKIPGSLLSDVYETLGNDEKLKVLNGVATTLRDLALLGVHHNDVRPWNIIVNNDGAWLIDYGLAGPIKKDNNVRALLRSVFVGSGSRDDWRSELSKTDRSAISAKLLKVIDGKNASEREMFDEIISISEEAIHGKR